MNLVAKKKFGQNFLVNEGLQKRFVGVGERVLEENNLNLIVEIGPGRGDLTQHLIKNGREVIAFDIDPEAIELNEEQFKEDDNFKIYHLDALQDLDKIKYYTKTDNFLFFSNLPFNVGSRILVDLPIIYPKILAVVVLQKEVINKLKKINKLTFFGGWINLFYDVKFEFDISPGNFNPAPKVVSTLVSLKPKDSFKNLPSEEKTKMQNILKKLFTYPSKTLTNNLKELAWNKEKIQQFLNENNLDKNIRLSWENYEGILMKIINFKH